MNDWTSVDDELPEPSPKTYLIANHISCEFYEYFVANRVQNGRYGNFWYVEQIGNIYDKDDLFAITHWQIVNPPSPDSRVGE